MKSPKKLILTFIIILSSAIGLYAVSRVPLSESPGGRPAVNTETAFAMEAFDSIKEHYWNKLSDEQLGNLYRLAADKITGTPHSLSTTTRQGVASLVDDSLAAISEPANKKIFALKLVSVVLNNGLEPLGRNTLYTQKDETALRNEVKNVDTGKDLYKELGVAAGASSADVQRGYDEKAAALTKENTPEAAAKLKELTYAKNVLTKTDTKARYDGTKVEPTVFAKALAPRIFYAYIKIFSPTTLDEFIKIFNGGKATGNNQNLVLDMRGNLGGAIDVLPYLLGFFVGNNEYPYSFYHQGDFAPQKTLVGYIPVLRNFKHTVLLVDGASQSTTELTAAVFKKYHLGVVVGAQTRGWGTIENTFPLKTTIDQTEKYSLYLVHSLTLRDDGTPIEGKGVDPNVSVQSPTWEKDLKDYVGDDALVAAVAKLIKSGPIQE